MLDIEVSSYFVLELLQFFYYVRAIAQAGLSIQQKLGVFRAGTNMRIRSPGDDDGDID